MKKIISAFILLAAAAGVLSGQVSGSGELTPVEQAYSVRLPGSVTGLSQMGYELLGDWVPAVTNRADDSYIVGPGDQLRIYLWGDPVDFGAVLGSYDVEVDADGSIFIRPVGRVSVYGQTIPQIVAILTDRFSAKYQNLTIDAAPLQLRKFSVYVSGFARSPGAVSVSNLFSAADILAAAGGVLPEGSLRSVRIIREGETVTVDLYDLLTGGTRAPLNTRVREGDIVYIPPLGRTAAVAGDVRRPGIYELSPADTVADMLEYAGGAGFAGAKPVIKLLRVTDTGSAMYEGDTSDEEFLEVAVQDGDIFILESGASPVVNLVQVSGPVRSPGLYTAASVPRLSDLIEKVRLLAETDTGTAVVTRKEVNRDEQKIIFSPAAVLAGTFDLELKPNDRVEFYSSDGFRGRDPILVVPEGAASQHVPFIPGITLLDVLKSIEQSLNPAELEARIIRDGSVIEQVVLREIMVRGKTEYNLPLASGDQVILLPLDESSAVRGVQVLGQVAKPGVYPLYEEATMYDMIMLAGGYTEKAYPQGAEVHRIAVREQQLEQFRLSLKKTQESLAQLEGALTYQDISSDARTALQSQITSQRAMLEEAEEKLGDSLGRIILTLPASLELLMRNEDNIRVQEGDTIFIPEKPMTVTIFGDIGTAAALPWVQGKTVRDYLFQLGGLRSRDYSLSIIKHNGTVVTEDNLFFGWSSIEQQSLEQGDAVIAVKRLTLPASSAFLESLARVTDTVYKTLYSLDAVGIL